MTGGQTLLPVFWAGYHVEIPRGLPTIPEGPYNTDLFAAKNLPFLPGEAAGKPAEPSSLAPLVQGIVRAGYMQRWSQPALHSVGGYWVLANCVAGRLRSLGPSGSF
jgi:hypothetical protein